MAILKAFLLGIVSSLLALFVVRRQKVDPKLESEEVKKSLDEIKEKVDETDLTELVDKSNERYRKL